MSMHADVNLSYEEYDLLWGLLHAEMSARNEAIADMYQNRSHGVAVEEWVNIYRETHDRCQAVMSKLEARFQH